MIVKKKKKLLIALSVFMFLGIGIFGIVIYSIYIWPGKAQQAFISHWSEKLQKIGSPSEIPERLKNHVYSLRFSNNEWLITAMDHSCCSGSGFNATVIRDSDGKVFYDTSHTFCGIEGMASELRNLNAASLKEFYMKATFLKLREKVTTEQSLAPDGNSAALRSRG